MFHSVLVLQFVISLSLAQTQYRDVTVGQGVVRGYNVDDVDVYSFYGIPYATAPTGEDRFKAPLPPASWHDVFNATEKFIVCPQENIYDYEVHIIMDCLRLNVFVPDTQEQNLPVLFIIHGGGYQRGHPDMYSPLNLVNRGMIVVNFSYRVGVHGFLCLNTEFAPGNAGMKDQIAALKWVKQNIARFGGDPDNITVGGSSSGSFCVDLQILSPMSDGLFEKAALISGASIGELAFTRVPLEIADIYAQKFGVTTSQDLNELERFYRSLSDEQIKTAYDSNPTALGFVPCVETHNLPGVDKFITEYPIDILKNGNFKRVTQLSGFTPMDGIEFLMFYDEFKPRMENNFRDFVPDAIQFDSEEQATETALMLKDVYFPDGEITLEGFAHFFTDTVFTHPQYASARLHVRNSSPLYMYLFSYNGTVNLPSVFDLPLWGPGHVTPHLYLFEHIASFIYANMTDEELVIREKLSDLYYHFVKDGVPKSDLVNITWTPMTDKVEYLLMDREFVIGQFPLKDRFSAWDRVYKYPYTTDNAGSSSLSIFAGVSCVVLVCFYKIYN